MKEKLEAAVEAVRALVRPVVTYGVVAAQVAFIGTGVVSGNFEAAEKLGPFTMMALSFYFIERALQKARNGG